MSTPIKRGDFAGLAEDYAKYRPGYSGTVLTALLALVEKPVAQIEAVDVGAGTGIWTAMLAARGCRSVTAVEPSADMRAWGERMTAGSGIRWMPGSGEQTGLPAASADWLSMASSFHWVDFETAMNEFCRVLRPQGRFVAVWNPRLIESSPLFVEIEEKLRLLKPDLSRVSSGRSGITERLTGLLAARHDFEDVVYVEGRHTRQQTPAEYLGAWRSVNDVQAQLGPERFRSFLEFVETAVAGMNVVETTYLTRAWCARRR